MLLHWTGSVLDEGAPFGISKLHSVRAGRVGLAVAASLCLDFARAVLTTFFSL